MLKKLLLEALALEKENLRGREGNGGGEGKERKRKGRVGREGTGADSKGFTGNQSQPVVRRRG